MSSKMSLFNSIELKFTMLMWIMGIWLTITWLMPILSLNIMDLAFPDTTGLFINMANLKSKTASMDTLFIILIVFEVLMLLIAMGVAIYYIYFKVKYGKNSKRTVAIMEQAWFRIGFIVLSMIFMLMVCVASVIQVTCDDSHEIEIHIHRAKYPPHKDNSPMNIKKYMKLSYEMAMGSPPAGPGVGTGGEMIVDENMLFFAEDMSSVIAMTPTQINDKMSRGEIILEGTPANANSLNKNKIYLFQMSGTVYNIMEADYKTFDYDLSKVTDDELMAQELVQTEDFSRENLAAFIKEKEGSITAPLRIMASEDYKSALALTYLMVTMESVRYFSYGYVGTVSHIPLEQAMGGVMRCQNGLVYADVLFFISFCILTVVIIAMFIISQVMGSFGSHIKGGSDEMVPLNQQEDEFDDDWGGVADYQDEE